MIASILKRSECGTFQNFALSWLSQHSVFPRSIVAVQRHRRHGGKAICPDDDVAVIRANGKIIFKCISFPASGSASWMVPVGILCRYATVHIPPSSVSSPLILIDPDAVIEGVTRARLSAARR